MKRILLGALLLLFTSTSVGAYGNFEDEQWPIPNEYGPGHHSVLIEDSSGRYDFMSYLRMTGSKGEFLCKSLDDVNCAEARFGNYNAILPPCSQFVITDCIVSLEAISSDGVVQKGKFKEFIYGLKHPNLFLGDGVSTPKEISEPGIWEIAGALHSDGNEYALSVGLSNSISRNPRDLSDADLDMQLYPISRFATGFTRDDANGFSNYYKCLQRIEPSGRNYVGCGGGAQEFGKYRCAMKMIEDATCLLRKPFPDGMRFRVSVQLTHEPAGMMHGRLFSPNIYFEKNANGVLLQVEAGSIKVPVLSYGDYFQNLSPELQTYWESCVPNNTCGFSSRVASGNDRNNAVTRNIQDYATPFGDRSIALVSIFSKAAHDKSVAAPSAWNIKTLSKDKMQAAAQCFKRENGFIGVVTTNSTTYSEGPPNFSDGALTYRVASLHFLPNGEEFLGTYNLILRSDVARCLYGFSRAPVSATVSVISADGKNQVATTVISERGNWLYLGAAGFTFSSPTVKVKLTQTLPKSSTAAGSANKAGIRLIEKVTLTCVKGKLERKVTSKNPKCPTGYKKKG